MSKYIDADLLREKIAEQMESLPREVGNCKNVYHFGSVCKALVRYCLENLI